MKVKILGSAAAEAVPALWCGCGTCLLSRKNGGKDIRRRTSYLIDDDTIIDFGPDIFYQVMSFNINLELIKRILLTHSHPDHLNPVDLEWRRKGFSVVSSEIKMFANNKVLEKIMALTKLSFETLIIEPHEIHAGIKIIDDNIEIHAIEANHCLELKDEQALNYVIGRNSKYILIANDTGWWPESSWIQIQSFKLDVAIIECTMGLRPESMNCRNGHLGANASVEFRNKLRDMGVITGNTQVFVNHFSHDGGPLHEKLCAFFEPHGINVAYDGLILDL